MGIIIDTYVFIKVEKKPQKIDFQKWAHYGEFYISAITMSELLVGTHLANTEARHLKRTTFVETIISKIKIIDFTKAESRIHAKLYAHLHKTGNMIGAHDLIIAATALTHNYAVLTSNHSEFVRVPGLTVLNLLD